MRRLCLFAWLFSVFIACSSTKPQTSAQTEIPADSVKREAVPSVAIDSAELLRKEIAHSSFLRALALENQGEFGLAEQFLSHARDADPDNRFLAFAVLELMDRRGASEEALLLAEKAKDLKGKKTSGQYALLGRIYSGASQLDSALSFYKKAVETNERNFRAMYEYSLLLEIVRDKEELMRVYGILLPQIGYPESMLERQVSLLVEAKRDSALAGLFGDVYDERGDRAFLERKIRLLFKMKRFEEALAAVEEFRADSVYADDTLSVKLLMAAYVDLKQDTVLLDTLKAIYKRHPSEEYFLLYVAFMETKLDMRDQAKVHWGRLSESSRYKATANGMLSAYALEDGDSSASLRYLEAAYRENPQEYYRPLLTRYLNSRDFSKAYGVLDSAIAFWQKKMESTETLDSIRTALAQENLNSLRLFDSVLAEKISSVHSDYGFVLQENALELEKIPASAENLQKGAELRRLSNVHFAETIRLGGESPAILLAYGANLFSLNLVDSAIAVFDRLLEKDALNAAAMNYLGYSLVDLNRNAEELQRGNGLIDKALALDSNLAFMDSKGWALFRLGKYEDALSLMERVESKAVAAGEEEWLYKDTAVFVHLAAICQALSQNERALEYYRKVLKIDPGNANAKKQVELLQRPVGNAEEKKLESGKKP